jgi:hypothetical protein
MLLRFRPRPSYPLAARKETHYSSSMERITFIIARLKSSPLFYLFLSSRELFHTNFWYWLSTINKTETIKLFSVDKYNGTIDFKREHIQNSYNEKAVIDLLISNDCKPAIVIENKVKDFPTKDQLYRIRSSFKEQYIKYVLVTLFETTDILFDGWTILTYKELSQRIDSEIFSNNDYYSSLIADYKEFTWNLACLSDMLGVRCCYDFAISFNLELFNKLNEIKLWEGYQKLRASHLLNCFEEYNIHQLKTAYRVNNQKATIDFFIVVREEYRIGIQIEDNQLRRFLDGANADCIAHKLMSDEIFFTKTFLSRSKKQFLKYGDKFRYQFEKTGRLDYTELFNWLNKQFDEIKSIQKEIEYKIPCS